MEGQAIGKGQTFYSSAIKSVTFLESYPVVPDRPSDNSSIEMKAIEWREIFFLGGGGQGEGFCVLSKNTTSK
jgi:hypothetical protein